MSLIRLALATGRPLMGPDGLENYHPRDLATLVADLDDQARQQRMAERREAAKQMTGR